MGRGSGSNLSQTQSHPLSESGCFLSNRSQYRLNIARTLNKDQKKRCSTIRNNGSSDWTTSEPYQTGFHKQFDFSSKDSALQSIFLATLGWGWGRLDNFARPLSILPPSHISSATFLCPQQSTNLAHRHLYPDNFDH